MYNKFFTFITLFVSIITLSACTDNTITCGEGQTLVDGVCQLESNVENSTDDSKDTTNTTPNINTGNNDDTQNNTVESEEPVIHLGAYNNTIYLNSTFTPPTCTVTDNKDSNLTCTIIENDVDTTKVGIYRVKYSVTDSDNYTTTKEATISVVDSSQATGDITLKPGMELTFNVGDTYINIHEYFQSTKGTVNPENVIHNIVLDADNKMIKAGSYTITVSIGGSTKEFDVFVINEGENPLDWITIGTPGIYQNPNRELIFNVGDYLPNFMEYFVAYDGTDIVPIKIENILHTLRLSADNRITHEGIVDVTVIAGNMQERFIIRVLAEGVNPDDVERPTELGLYRNFEGKTLEFNVGDRLPDFSTYFLGFDGEDYVVLHPGMTIHNILLTDDNVITTPGTYTITISVEINNYVFRDEFTITVS